MDKELITEIIRKFLQGKCNDEEFAYLLFWYESFDEDMPLQMSNEDKEALRTGILGRIRSNIPELGQLEGMSGREIKAIRRRRVLKVWKYAAAAVIAALITWGGITLFSSAPSRFTDHGRLSGKENGMISLSNHSERVHFLYLSDSSKVWLNPGSRLLYPEKFSGKERKVQLTGEAFFDIKHDAGHPFVVRGGDLITTVLGTSFLFKTNAASYPEVTVLTGKVAVAKISRQKDRVILTAAQSVVLNKKDRLIKEINGNDNTLQRWQNTSLTFNNVPFAQVIQTLDKRFGVQMFCKDEKINGYQLNADFTNQNLPDILEMLGQSLNISYDMVDDSVINFYKIQN